MKKNNSKFIQTKSRREIISANIDDLIDERNMTPTEFQEKMGMSKQDYYKKKSVNGSSYNEEDIIKAAKVLDVTINDIYYDKEEKKSVEVLKIRKYDNVNVGVIRTNGKIATIFPTSTQKSRKGGVLNERRQSKRANFRKK